MKTRIYLLALLFTCSLMGNSNTVSAKANLTKEQQEVRVMEIKNRVDQISAMDFSQLNTEQRASLRHELKDMKKELTHTGPVVLIFSTGALILLIILLIILL